MPRLSHCASIVATLVAAVMTAGCGSSESLQLPPNKDDSGASPPTIDQPVSLAGPEATARAATAITGAVLASAQAFGELGDAVGDLVPSPDNPCPDGGSAEGDISGSIIRPRVRMTFHDCVRGDFVLDGSATITCDDFNGSDCRRGDAVIGADGEPLYFESREAGREGIILLLGTGEVALDSGANSLQANLSLQGERRALAGDRHYSFVTEALDVTIREVSDTQVEARIEGVSGFGNGDSANCAGGRFDTATPADPLIVEGTLIRSGELQFFSPPPRPGTQQARATYTDGALTAAGADGSQQFYSASELADYCALN